MLWPIMTITASTLAVTYLGVSASGRHLRLSPDRRATFHRAGILLVGWAAVGYGHLLLVRRG